LARRLPWLQTDVPEDSPIQRLHQRMQQARVRACEHAHRGADPDAPNEQLRIHVSTPVAVAVAGAACAIMHSQLKIRTHLYACTNTRAHLKRLRAV